MNIINEFTQYLSTLGYSQSVCYNSPNQINHLLQFCPLSKLSIDKIEDFITYLTTIKSERTKRYRSNIHINGYINSIKRFCRFLDHCHSIHIPIEQINYLSVQTPEKSILTINQIKMLFQQCDNSTLGMRDKAMLSIYYSCGLRRNEGIHLQCKDINFHTNTLFVQYGKGGKQRTIPFTDHTHQTLKQYIRVGRRRLNKYNYRNPLFLSVRGEKIQSQSMLLRLRTLCNKANIKQRVGLHTLRHSIATHLLHQQMDIYQISSFLGHSSLESTQIYTHINP